MLIPLKVNYYKCWSLFRKTCDQCHEKTKTHSYWLGERWLIGASAHNLIFIVCDDCKKEMEKKS